MTSPQQENSQPTPVVFTDRVRRWTETLTSSVGGAAVQLGVHPDTITIVGTLFVLVAAVLIGRGELQWGALLLMLSLPLDALDGAVARAMQRKDHFGAMLDSTLDRYADAFIFSGLSYYFAVQNQFEMMLLALAALVGSYGVSYVRARGEGLGLSVKIGAFSRLERLVVILLMLWFPALLGIGLLILAVGTNFTSLQRLWFVYRALKKEE
jgi:CDP-diacylglycerol---glycerol-3-phosphate 3-phosphatidyltransferase